MFATDAASCHQCVIVHNNYIVSMSAKVYRFKELLMWMVDRNGYYSNTQRKYLTFDNPIDFGPEFTLEHELLALRTALRIGNILNRTVILPAFHCHGCYNNACRNSARRCSLSSFIRMTSFDANMHGKYREHMFLHHPKVPQSIKDDKSNVIFINSTFSDGLFFLSNNTLEPFDVSFSPVDRENGASSKEIKEWFRPFHHHSVLQFHSLYVNSNRLLQAENESIFEKHLNNSMDPCDYRQGE